MIARDVKVAEHNKWNWEVIEIEGTILEHQIKIDVTRDFKS